MEVSNERHTHAIPTFPLDLTDGGKDVLYFFQIFVQLGNFARHLQTIYQERKKNTHDDPARCSERRRP